MAEVPIEATDKEIQMMMNLITKDSPEVSLRVFVAFCRDNLLAAPGSSRPASAASRPGSASVRAMPVPALGKDLNFTPRRDVGDTGSRPGSADPIRKMPMPVLGHDMSFTPRGGDSVAAQGQQSRPGSADHTRKMPVPTLGQDMQFTPRKGSAVSRPGSTAASMQHMPMPALGEDVQFTPRQGTSSRPGSAAPSVRHMPVPGLGEDMNFTPRHPPGSTAINIAATSSEDESASDFGFAPVPLGQGLAPLPPVVRVSHTYLLSFPCFSSPTQEKNTYTNARAQTRRRIDTSVCRFIGIGH